MLKKSLFAVAVVALLATMAPAGSIKLADWPTTYVFQEICDIPVFMDIGFYVFIPDQDKLKIKMSQTSGQSGEKHSYSGSCNVNIQCNFNIKLDTSRSKVGSWEGDFGSSVSPNTLSAGGGTVTVTATASNVKLTTGGFLGGQKDVRVGTVTLKVAPQ